MINRANCLALVAIAAMVSVMGCTKHSAQLAADTHTASPMKVAPEDEAKLPTKATGTLVSSDGQTTGEVEVNIVTESNGVKLAHVEFKNLTTPHERLSVGSALAPRKDDPCFDEKLRGSGGEHPAPLDTPPYTLPAYERGWYIYEVVLFTPNRDHDPTWECFNRVVATAPLVWE